jgi:hypothetical protein
MPPLPEPNEEEQALPGSMRRYRVASRIYYAYNGSTETDIWRATRKADGREVVLKRMATPLWQSEHELSMHLAATSVPGTHLSITPLLHRSLTSSSSTLHLLNKA